MPTFLLVPGAWLGGWCWRDVAVQLQRGNHRVIPSTLTGLGERTHLLTPQIGLCAHVADVVSMLHYRNLNDVILVGHSYGGIVITAVAEQVPDRIRWLIYLDASVPRDGESHHDVVGPEMAARLRSAAESGGEGWRVPPAPLCRGAPSRCHPALGPGAADAPPSAQLRRPGAASFESLDSTRAPSFGRPCKPHSTRG